MRIMDNQSSFLLSVRDLKTYFFMDEGVVKAVDGVTFGVNPGQVFGIVGESGCGKSVTMKAVLRIVEPPGRIVNGQILLRCANKDVSGCDTVVDLAKLEANSKEMRDIRGAEIALIPQEPMAAFSPVHTVGDQIIEAITLHQDVSKRAARGIALQMFKDVGIPIPEQRLDEFSWQLSGGLRQRAIIAMALSCHPRLLIADEPTTAVDVTTQAQVLRLLRRLQEQRNAAIIFITHDLGVIAQMADYVMVMYLGLVMEEGPVDVIFHAPKHPYTQALLRSIPTITMTPRINLPTISGSIPHPFNKPRGCPFHPRCEKAMAGKCDVRVPALQAIGEKQAVSCFLFHDVEVTT
jgi:peptide/nickel transport system ATP-binding protein